MLRSTLIPNRKLHRTLAACLLAGSTAMALPHAAAASGTVGVAITPRGDAAQVISTGLALYSAIRTRKNNAKIDQRGAGNAAAVAQNGSGNLARVVQRGKGHTGTITQDGNSNSFLSFQFGRRTTNHVTQSGNGKVGLGLQFGW